MPRALKQSLSPKFFEIESLNTSYYTYANDPKKNLVLPATKGDVPFLDFSSLENALLRLQDTAEMFQRVASSGLALYSSDLQQANMLIYQSERKLLLPDGLPIRPWYKHAIYAPGYYTGYGVKTLPGIREAIEGRRWNEAQQQIAEAAKAINAYTEQINSTMALLVLHK